MNSMIPHNSDWLAEARAIGHILQGADKTESKAGNKDEQAQRAAVREKAIAAQSHLRDMLATMRQNGATASEMQTVLRGMDECAAVIDTAERGGAVNIVALQQQLDAVKSKTDATIASAISSSAASGTSQSIVAQLTQRSETMLSEYGKRIDARQQEMFGLGRKYGIDLSEHEERERDLKRQEEELRKKGDMIGALGVRDDRYENEIDGHKKLIDSGKLNDEEERKEKDRIRQAREEQLETIQRKYHHERAEGRDTSATEHRMHTVTDNIRKEFGDKEADRIVKATKARTAIDKEENMALRVGAQEPHEAKEDAAKKNNSQVEANFKDMQAPTQSFDIAGIAEPSGLLDASTSIKEQAKAAALPAVAAGAADSSRTADLSADAKDSAILKSADAGKAPASRAVG